MFLCYNVLRDSLEPRNVWPSSLHLFPVYLLSLVMWPPNSFEWLGACRRPMSAIFGCSCNVFLWGFLLVPKPNCSVVQTIVDCCKTAPMRIFWNPGQVVIRSVVTGNCVTNWTILFSRSVRQYSGFAARVGQDYENTLVHLFLVPSGVWCPWCVSFPAHESLHLRWCPMLWRLVLMMDRCCRWRSRCVMVLDGFGLTSWNQPPTKRIDVLLGFLHRQEHFSNLQNSSFPERSKQRSYCNICVTIRVHLSWPMFPFRWKPAKNICMKLCIYLYKT